MRHSSIPTMALCLTLAGCGSRERSQSPRVSRIVVALNRTTCVVDRSVDGVRASCLDGRSLSISGRREADSPTAVLVPHHMRLCLLDRGAAWLACSNSSGSQPEPEGDVVDAAFGLTSRCTVSRAGALRCRTPGQGGTFMRESILYTELHPSLEGTKPARRVASGTSHSCALLAGGALRCWGDNVSGQVTGIRGDLVDLPAEPGVLAGREVVEVCATQAGTCARIRSAGALCWGSLGSRPQTFSTPDAVEIACGRNAVCVRHTSGQVECAGLPDGTEGATGRTALVRELPSPPIGITVGIEHACADLGGGQAHCWGRKADFGCGPGFGEGAPCLVAPASSAAPEHSSRQLPAPPP